MRRAVFASLSFGVILVACGSRGPLDITGGPYDASVEAQPVIDASTQDVQEAAPRDAGAVVNCLSCVQQNCGSQLLMCVTSPQCRMTLQCAVQNCFNGGGSGFDPQCLLQKCGSDISGFAQVLSVVTCVTGKCGESCIQLLGGLGMMDIIPADQ